MVFLKEFISLFIWSNHVLKRTQTMMYQELEYLKVFSRHHSSEKHYHKLY